MPSGQIRWRYPMLNGANANARTAMAGISSGANELSLRGDPATGAFSVFCFRDRRLLAVESVNRPQDQRAARKLILTQGLTPDQARDEDVDLRAITAVRQECIGA